MQKESAETLNGNEKRITRGKRRKFQFKKKHIKWVVLLGIVIIIAIVVITCTNSINQMVASMNSLSDTTVLEYQNLRDTISATGRVESANKTNVYSTMSYSISALHVEVGDYVQAGDVLLELDRESIEKQIAEKELSMESSAASTGQAVKTARDTYDSYRSSLKNNTNSALISALNSVDTALDNWEKAQKAYDEYKHSLNIGDNSTILAQETAVSNAADAMNKASTEMTKALTAKTAAEAAVANYSGATMDATAAQTALTVAESALLSAETLLNNARTDYTNRMNDYNSANPSLDAARQALLAAEQAVQIAQTTYDNAVADRNQKAQLLATIQATGDTSVELEKLKTSAATAEVAYEAATNAYNSARAAYNNASASYTSALRNAENALADHKKSVDTAQRTYETALTSLAAAEASAQTQLDAYQNSLNSARINSSQDLAEYQLEKMQQDLLKASITAPVSGVVTAVYAIEGATSTGLLFVIEDTTSLIVETTVKEYDIETVKEGMRVTIKSDATGDEEYTGVVTRIAPTANKNAQGNTDTTSDVQFDTEVTVSSTGTPLRIGMSVRLNYIIEEAADVLTVPYDAIYQNDAGEDSVLAAIEQPDGKYLLQEMLVTLGIENDLDVVVSGEGLFPGLRIMNNPDNYAPGQEIVLMEQSLSDLAGSGMNMPFMMRRN